MSLQHLPAELFDAVLNQAQPRDLQQSALALTRAIPSAPIRLEHLFRSIRISHPRQMVSIYQRLLKASRNSSTNNEDASPRWVRYLFIESWTVDAEVVLNLLRILPNIEIFGLWVGPNNFAPEHLEDMFSKPILTLRSLSIRFRPYVQKATYYQFLKGAYFDSALLALSRWPAVDLPAISIVQDPFEPDPEQVTQAFAQPLVFFRLDPSVLSLLTAQVSDTLTALRLRVPSRPVTRSLCGPLSTGLSNSPNPFPDLPDLDYLDLSTCYVLESEIDSIMLRLPTLKHLVLDGCATHRGDVREGEWASLGKRCALVGAKRAKEREKALRAWFEEKSILNPQATNANPNNPHRTKRTKRGRKGLATATISLRQTQSNIVPTSSPTRIVATEASVLQSKKIRILPEPPNLRSLSITIPSVHKERHAALRAEFEAGWAEGIAQLTVTIGRLRASARNGYRVMRAAGVDEDSTIDGSNELLLGLDGLVDVKMEDGLRIDEQLTYSTAPVLCFAGQEGIDHEKGCGHNIGLMLDI